MALTKFHHQEQTDQLIELLINYHDSGKYHEDLNRAGEQGIDYLKNLTFADIESRSTTMVLDIE